MGFPESVKIGLLRETDIPAALQIQEAERWNQSARDWKRLLTLNPDGCFAAFSDGKLIGTITVITYGGHLAWIGMMLVAQEYRRRGVGKQLLRRALDHCERRGIATVKLDATPAGRPLYESLRFVPECGIERWQGLGHSKLAPSLEAWWNEKQQLAVCEFDEKAFHAPRRDLLHSLLLDCCVMPALETDDSGHPLAGYALARGGARACYVGPVVALEQGVAVRLLDSLLERLAGEVFLDICLHSTDFVASLVQRGFAKQRCLTRMVLAPQSIPTSPMVFSIAGPELG